MAYPTLSTRDNLLHPCSALLPFRFNCIPYPPPSHCTSAMTCFTWTFGLTEITSVLLSTSKNLWIIERCDANAPKNFLISIIICEVLVITEDITSNLPLQNFSYPLDRSVLSMRPSYTLLIQQPEWPKTKAYDFAQARETCRTSNLAGKPQTSLIFYPCSTVRPECPSHHCETSP
jgi:hypothetical protein